MWSSVPRSYWFKFSSCSCCLELLSHSQGSIGSGKWFIMVIVSLVIKFSSRYVLSWRTPTYNNVQKPLS